jgi:hypothetical protein
METGLTNERPTLRSSAGRWRCASEPRLCYGGVIIDAGHTGRTATFFVPTPRNIQYEAIADDSSGDDSSPDFFGDSATRITERGWTAEIRVPFPFLRYLNIDPQTWGAS